MVVVNKVLDKVYHSCTIGLNNKNTQLGTQLFKIPTMASKFQSVLGQADLALF